MLKIGKFFVKFWVLQIFKGDGPQYTQISVANMCEFIKISYDIPIQCHGNYMEIKEFNYMLEIDFLRNDSQKYLGVLCMWGDF